MAIEQKDLPQPIYSHKLCGCELRFGHYENVYEVAGKLHCQSCMEEAIESKFPVLVRRVR